MELFICFFSLVRIYMNWISYNKISIPLPVTKALRPTLLCFQKYAFQLSSKAHQSMRYQCGHKV